MMNFWRQSANAAKMRAQLDRIEERAKAAGLRVRRSADGSVRVLVPGMILQYAPTRIGVTETVYRRMVSHQDARSFHRARAVGGGINRQS